MGTWTGKALIAASIAAAGFLLPACAHPVTLGMPAASPRLTPITAPTRTTAPVPTAVPSPAPAKDTSADWMIDFDTTSDMSTSALFRMAAEHAQAFWADQYGVPTDFPVEAENHSLTCPDGSDHHSAAATFCGASTPQVLVFQPSEVGKFRSSKYPDTSLVIVAAHEVGHMVGDVQGYTPTSRDARELSAECFAGAYINALGVPGSVAVAAFARTVYTEPDSQAHGRAFMRGYTSSDPLSTCTSF